jgi:dynein heavy chain
MADDLEVQMLLATLNEVLAKSEHACAEFRAKYEAFAYLYTTPMDEAFAAFVADAYVDLPKSEEQLTFEANLPNTDDVPKQPRVPDLAKFDAVVTKYTEVAEAVNVMKTPTDIGWLRVNSQPIKYSLQTLAQQWAQRFMAHLQDYVSGTVSELAAFVDNTVKGLEEEVTGQDPLALRRCMGYIRNVKQTRYVRKAIIAPLRKHVSLLKKHGADVNALVLPSGTALIDYLDQADLKVEHAINKTFQKKEAIFPYQTAEMEKIKAQALSFDESMRSFCACRAAACQLPRFAARRARSRH